ncbi:MAG: hypothetical protein KKC26_02040 [Nanoarchaeota archaeon]|nr:hypothetical protein [Nanoarchaeota archaeon]
MSSLDKFVFLKSDIEKLAHDFELVEKTVNSNLSKAEAYCFELKKNPPNKNSIYGKINELFSYLNSFHRLFFGTNEHVSNYDILTIFDSISVFRNKAEKMKTSKEVIKLVDEFYFHFRHLRSERELDSILKLFYSYSDKIKHYFKMKHSIVGLSKLPFLRESIKIDGKHTVHLNISFSKDLNPEGLDHFIKSSFNFYEAKLEHTLEKEKNTLISNLLLKLQTKKQFYEANGLDKFLNSWLLKLKDLLIRVFRDNISLMLTPSLSCNLIIISEMGGYAFCSGKTLIDYYILEIEIGTILTFDVFCRDFYESTPSEVFAFLHNNRKAGLFTSSAFSTQNINKIFGSLSSNFEPVRTWSLYSIAAHELSHAFDSDYLFKINRLMPFIHNLIQQDKFYEKHHSLNISNQIISFSEFFVKCRIETIPQFEEFIVKTRDSSQTSRYCFVSPILYAGQIDVLKKFNDTISSIENNPLENSNYSFHSLSSLAYGVGFVMALTIFLADCKRKKVDLLIIDNHDFVIIQKAFPKAFYVLRGFSDESLINEGSPDWFLLQSLKKQDVIFLRQFLQRHNLKQKSLSDIPSLIESNMQFYIFRPPLDIMMNTFAKLKKTNEIQFFEMYQKACDFLGLKNQFVTLKGISGLFEKFSDAYLAIDFEDNSKNLNFK